MRESWITAVVVVLMSAGASAQVVLPAGTQVILPAQLPSIGLPLPPIGLPLPEIAQPLPGTVPSTHVPPARMQQRHDSGGPGRTPGVRPGYGPRRRGAVPYGTYYPFIYAVPPIVVYDSGVAPATAAPAPAPAPVPTMGRLRLEVEPGGALPVYVDNFYVGTLEQLDGELELEQGAHKISIRAPGYKPLTFDANIVADRATTYRGTLTAEDTTPAAAAKEAPPAPPSTFYLIPGCYVGNTPPKAANLPDGCDVARLQTFKP